MRALLPLVVLLSAAACTHEDCEDCNLGPPTPHVDLYDDGTTLSVLGCDLVSFGGCEGTGAVMTVAIGGQVQTVPEADSGSGDASLGGEARAYDHRLDVPSPAAGAALSATYDGVTTENLADLPAFTVDGPASATRGSDAPAVHFQVLQNTTAQVVMTSTCDGGAPTQEALTSSPTGDVTVVFPPASGACTHEVDVAQTITYLTAPPSDLEESATRIATLSFTSAP